LFIAILAQFYLLQIATALSTTEDFAKTRYNTIRTRLTKYLGKLKSHHGSVAAGTAKPSFESLRWLYPHIEHRYVTFAA